MRLNFQIVGVIITISAAAVGSLTSAHAEAWNFTVLHSACSRPACKDGYNPQGPLLRHDANTYYGTMTSDDDLAGNVFQIKYDPAKGKWLYHVIHRFCYCSEGGRGPIGNLIEDVSGDLYGVTAADGAHGNGTVFELVPNADRSTWSFQVLHDFPGEGGDGRYPAGGLTYLGADSGALYDGVSPLYGLANEGGAKEDGIAYALTPCGATWTESILYSFCGQTGCADGSKPIGRLVMDAGGNLFGVTSNGGNRRDGGVVFEISGGSGTWTETVLHSFCMDKRCTDGDHPNNSMLIDVAGNLYGTTFSGGGSRKSAGAIFRVAPEGADWSYTVLYSFCQRKACRDGRYPRSNLAMDDSGNIYGATYEGGSNDDGSVFRLTGTDLATLWSFCSLSGCADTNNPYGVTWDPAGNLFGTAYGSGAGGVVYELSP